MRSHLRVGFVYTMSVLGAVCLATAQNNVNIYGEGGTSAPIRDTVLTKDTIVTEGAQTTTTEVQTQATVTPDAAVQDQAVDTVGDIEPSDVKRLQRRKEAKRFSMAGFGPAGFGNNLMDDADNRMVYDVYVGRAWEVSPRAAIKSIAEVTSDFDDNHMADLSLGANFYALPTDFSPYLGGDLGLGAGRGQNENVFGFTASGSIGALLFRTANAQMNIEGGAEVLMSELDDQFPTVYSATVGVLF